MNAKMNPFLVAENYLKAIQVRKPRAEVYNGMPAIRKNLKPDGSYQQLTHLETGKLIGLSEGNYKLIEKDGELIEETWSDVLDNKFSIYRVVKGKDGKIKSLSENTGYPYRTLTLTEDANGNIQSKTTTALEKILNAPNDLAKNVDAINAVKRYNGKTETSADALELEGIRAILSGLSGIKPKF